MQSWCGPSWRSSPITGTNCPSKTQAALDPGVVFILIRRDVSLPTGDQLLSEPLLLAPILGAPEIIVPGESI
jgi:hypothetical protein